MTDEDDNSISVTLPYEKAPARTPQAENLRNQLGKLGNTPFELERLDIFLSGDWFIPSSVLADLRRTAVEKLLEARRINYPQERVRFPKTVHAFPAGELTYLGNVMNGKAQAFYHDHGVKRVHHKVKSPYREPYYLVSTDGRRFRLDFDCKVCQMKVSLDNRASS